MSPTRELASQTEKNIMALGEFMKVRAHCCIGGKSIGERNVVASTGSVLSPLQAFRVFPPCVLLPGPPELRFRSW